jgi:tetratricopeptide (TPR) repeat protein
MNKKIFWLSIAAVIASFVGGFFTANSLNRKDLSDLRAENERLKKNQVDSNQTVEEMSLTEDEIRAKIAEADKNPNNLPFQKNLGLALYNYASMKQNAELLAEVSRLLTRVYDNDQSDYQIVVTLGNIKFDIGYFKKNNDDFKNARVFYQKALEQKPKDVDVRTDLGLTYFLSNPPEADPAIVEFQKSIQINPKHEKTLQVLIQALLSQNKRDEAEKYIARLREVNPENQILMNLNAPFSTAESNLQK